MFADVLPLIVRTEEVELLLRMSEKELSMTELSKLSSLPQIVAQSKVNSLYRRGFLKKRGRRYSVRPFERIISRHLSEGRVGALGKHVAALADYRMDEHVRRAEADPHPEGKVLPIPGAVIEPVSVVLPYETAISILVKARSMSVRDCGCRVTYRNCSNPLGTCLAINEFSDELVERGVATEIPLEEAKEVLKMANVHGLVNQALYTDWLKGEVFDICSCCSCCCVYLRAFMNYGVKHHIARSGLVAKVSTDKCTGCGVCLERCMFGARRLDNGKSVVIRENCYGCGLCTTACEAQACRLVSDMA
ncbi:4Fe-4S dicluster domain-containing protein [[Eubacterium] cellulosolvens]